MVAESAEVLAQIPGAHVHLSGIDGLIDATRRAYAVIGVDSGPMHLAAALGKPGVAIFGPTDPTSHGPYGGSLRVLRAAGAETTYKRHADVHESMTAITPAAVATHSLNRSILNPIPNRRAARREFSQNRYADAVAKLRVPVGFVLVIAFWFLATPTWGSLAVGVPVSLAGLALRAWAAGHLEKNQNLANGGPYAYVRNPLYLGTLTVAAGFAIAARRWNWRHSSVRYLLYSVVELGEHTWQMLFSGRPE